MPKRSLKPKNSCDIDLPSIPELNQFVERIRTSAKQTQEKIAQIMENLPKDQRMLVLVDLIELDQLSRDSSRVSDPAWTDPLTIQMTGLSKKQQRCVIDAMTEGTHVCFQISH